MPVAKTKAGTLSFVSKYPRISRPTIFLSGVSHEFGSFRDAVQNRIWKKGCLAEYQSSFPTDYGNVEEMLRRKLTKADAVVHIVGFRFGTESKQRPPDGLLFNAS